MVDVGRSGGREQGSQAGGERDGYLDTGRDALIHPLTQYMGHPVGNLRWWEKLKLYNSDLCHSKRVL